MGQACRGCKVPMKDPRFDYCVATCEIGTLRRKLAKARRKLAKIRKLCRATQDEKTLAAVERACRPTPLELLA